MNQTKLHRLNNTLFCSPTLSVFIGICAFTLDAITKYLTQLYLPAKHFGKLVYPYSGIGVFKDFLGIEFSINHQTNTGAAWGILGDYQFILLVARILMVLFLLGYVVFLNKHPHWRIPLALIIAGATGNIVDYFLYGHVIDMFHFVFWGFDYPVFNVADSVIFLGIFWLFIASLFEAPSH